jgi:alkylation response protein AidB-like acyl-CoA dehydrogenase
MAEQTIEHAQPLTVFAEDEAIFRDSVREFAEAQVRPLVREMDEHAKIPRALVDKLFDLGVGDRDPGARGRRRELSIPCRRRGVLGVDPSSASSWTCRTHSS